MQGFSLDSPLVFLGASLDVVAVRPAHQPAGQRVWPLDPWRRCANGMVTWTCPLSPGQSILPFKQYFEMFDKERFHNVLALLLGYERIVKNERLSIEVDESDNSWVTLKNLWMLWCCKIQGIWWERFPPTQDSRPSKCVIWQIKTRRNKWTEGLQKGKKFLFPYVLVPLRLVYSTSLMWHGCDCPMTWTCPLSPVGLWLCEAHHI